MNIIFYYVPIIILVLRQCESAPIGGSGTYFWKPRMAINLGDELTSTLKPRFRVNFPSVKRIKEGRVVILDGYRLGMTMMSIASVISDRKPKFAHLDLTSASFYTNVYRWFLRALSLIPEWLAAPDAIYPDTHKVWRKRFFYMEEKVPDWLRKMLFFVGDWDEEDGTAKTHKNFTINNQYQLYAEPAFGKHYRYPSQVFNNFASFQQSKETVENFDNSDMTQPASIRDLTWAPKMDYMYRWPHPDKTAGHPKKNVPANGTIYFDPAERDTYLRPVFPPSETLRPVYKHYVG